MRFSIGMMQECVVLFSSLWKTKAITLGGGGGRAPASTLAFFARDAFAVAHRVLAINNDGVGVMHDAVEDSVS